jgi:hypothetical protein
LYTSIHTIIIYASQDKPKEAYPCHEIVLIHKKKRAIDRYYNMGEPWKHAKLKKSPARHIFHFNKYPG